jgi:hypothetical protein
MPATPLRVALDVDVAHFHPTLEECIDPLITAFLRMWDGLPHQELFQIQRLAFASCI